MHGSGYLHLMTGSMRNFHAFLPRTTSTGDIEIPGGDVTKGFGVSRCP